MTQPRAGLKKLGIAAISAVAAGLVAYRGYTYWQDRQAAAAGLVYLGTFTDDLCACRDRECVRQIFDTRGDQIDRAEKAALDVKANHDRVEALGARVAACIDSLPED